MPNRIRLKFKSLVSRLTGLSVGLDGLGVSWNPPTDERDQVRRLLTFLEDRRVLYVAEYLEVPSHVSVSVLEIRKEITATLQKLPESSKAANILKAMRAACRKFLEEDYPDFRHVYIAGPHPVRNHGRNGELPGFFVALGELRAVFGIHIARLAYEYQIDLEEELTAILPAVTDEGARP